MYSLDENVHLQCIKCGNHHFFDSYGIQIKETGINSLIYLDLGACDICGNQFMFGYSFHQIKFSGFTHSVTRFSHIGFTTSVDISIIEKPIHISKIKNLDSATYNRILSLMSDISNDPNILNTTSRRDFEYIVAELIRRKGFNVEVTKQTRDGGKDIIAIKNISGIPIKLFIECKHPDRGNIIGIDYIRSLYGVHNSKNSPNKSILVTSSYFSRDAHKFVKNETNSTWDLSLYDYEHLMDWLKISV